MSFIDDSKKNVEFMVEVTAGTGGGAHAGRRGHGIDDLFAGPFHPDYNEVGQTLKKQVKDRLALRKKMRTTVKPDPIGGYYDVETDDVMGAYDELTFLNQAKKAYSDRFTPLYDLRWKSTSWDYNFDEIDSSMGRDRRNKMFDKDFEPAYIKTGFLDQSEENTERTLTAPDYRDWEDFGEESVKKQKEEDEEEQLEEVQLNEEDFIRRSEINVQTVYKNDIGLSISIGS